MMMISDLTLDLVVEILSRVSITSLGAVRSTCKPWRAICKDPKFTKKHHGALLNMSYDTCDINTLIFSLVHIGDLPSIKEIAKIHCPVKVWRVYLCGGLFLCVDKNDKLLLWNPYLAQTRYIQNFGHRSYSYVLGCDNNNNNPKVLRISSCDESIEYHAQVEIYDLKSNSWRVLDITPNSVWSCFSGVSLKGNTYFVERKHWPGVKDDCVVCFDFTTERLRSPLLLPFNAATEDDVEISCVRDEQLALLFQRCLVTYEIEFWITINIEHNVVSWTKLFKVDMKPLAGFGFQPKFNIDNFYVDKEKKVAVVCGASRERKISYFTSYVVGEDGNHKEMDPRDVFYYTPSHVCLST